MVLPTRKNYVSDPGIYRELKNNFREKDAVLGDSVREFKSIITVEDFGKEVQKLTRN